MSTLNDIEKQVAERAKADRRRLAAARARADEDLGARLRALLAPTATRAEQVERAAAWLDKHEAEKAARVGESEPERAFSEHTEPEHREGDGEHYPA